MRAIIVTTHARERIAERIGDKRKALKKLRRAKPVGKQLDGSYVYKNDGWIFIIEKVGKAWKLITLYSV